MSVYYIFGALCGFGIAAAVLILCKKTAREKGTAGKFDERQIAEQGRAYKIGFFTMILSSLLYGITASVADWTWCEPVVGVAICVCLSIVVWASICIWHDAYFRTSDSPRAIQIIFAFMGLGNIALGVSHILDGDIVENGVLGTHSLNLIVGLMLFFVCVVALWKSWKDRREAE